MGVFSWGYMTSQIPAGIMAERFGGKYIFGFGILFTGIFNILTPLAARSSLPALYTVRVLTGIAEVGCIFLISLVENTKKVFFFIIYSGGNNSSSTSSDGPMDTQLRTYNNIVIYLFR